MNKQVASGCHLFTECPSTQRKINGVRRKDGSFLGREVSCNSYFPLRVNSGIPIFLKKTPQNLQRSEPSGLDKM